MEKYKGPMDPYHLGQHYESWWYETHGDPHDAPHAPIIDNFDKVRYNIKMTDTPSLLDAQKAIHEKMAAMKEELRVIGDRLFREGAQDIFDKYPKLLSFGWTQYTPYFNDGDECVFSVHAGYGVRLTFKGQEDEQEDEEDFSSYNGKYADPSVELPSYYEHYSDKRWVFAAGAEASSLAGGVDDDTMKALFGDHARVTVTRDGIEVTEYEHD